jgi:hypothetical protein
MLRETRVTLFRSIRNLLREDLLNNPHAREEALSLFRMLPEDSEKSMYFRRKLDERINRR